MSQPFDPYDADRPAAAGLLLRRPCVGREHAVATLRERSESTEFEADSNAFVEATLVKALFPQDALRRNFLRAVGRRSAMAAIGSVLPIASLQAMAQEKGGTLEKKDLKVGFIPITCATPLIMPSRWASTRSRG